MKKLIILLFCSGIFVSMVGCGNNTTVPPSTKSLPTTVLETILTETPLDKTPPITAVEPTEKEKEPTPTENKDPTTNPTTTAPTATENPKAEIKSTITNTTSQLTESETTAAEPLKEEQKVKTEPPKVSKLEPETTQPKFDIHYWITFVKKYATSIGLTLDSKAIECWDNPIRAGAHCIYLERDIQSRLNRYSKDEDITDVWIWAETTDNDCYDIYIGYA